MTRIFSMFNTSRTPLFAGALLLVFLFVSCDSGDPRTSPKEKDSTAKQSPKVVDQVRIKDNLGSSLKGYVDSIFTNYKVVKMDPLDALPKFKKARNSIYKRLRRRKPIATKISKSAYPRLLIKAFEFSSEKDADDVVRDWLNGHESSAENIELGDAVDALKSPPLLCAAVGKRFYIVQSSCIYGNEEWEQTVGEFFEAMEKDSARYAFQVNCKAGQLNYLLGGKD